MIVVNGLWIIIELYMKPNQMAKPLTGNSSTSATVNEESDSENQLQLNIDL